MDTPDTILAAAETVATVLDRLGVGALVIGGIALAAHHYVRHTDDLDVGVNTRITTLGRVAAELRAAGFDVELREPDADDPLGGVIDVTGPFGLIQVVNFGERFPAVIDDALKSSPPILRPGSPLRIVPLPHLIALKLYAGGYRAKADIVELLRRNPGADATAIRTLCQRYRLRGLDELIREAGREP